MGSFLLVLIQSEYSVGRRGFLLEIFLFLLVSKSVHRDKSFDSAKQCLITTGDEIRTTLTPKPVTNMVIGLTPLSLSISCWCPKVYLGCCGCQKSNGTEVGPRC